MSKRPDRLIDARFERALEYAPDADLCPGEKTRETILHAARQAIEVQPRPQTNTPSRRKGLMRLRMPWNAGFATAVVVVSVVLVWHNLDPSDKAPSDAVSGVVSQDISVRRDHPAQPSPEGDDAIAYSMPKPTTDSQQTTVSGVVKDALETDKHIDTRIVTPMTAPKRELSLPAPSVMAEAGTGSDLFISPQSSRMSSAPPETPMAATQPVVTESEQKREREVTVQADAPVHSVAVASSGSVSARSVSAAPMAQQPGQPLSQWSFLKLSNGTLIARERIPEFAYLMSHLFETASQNAVPVEPGALQLSLLINEQLTLMQIDIGKNGWTARTETGAHYGGPLDRDIRRAITDQLKRLGQVVELD